jgi:hypothetical protein
MLVEKLANVVAGNTEFEKVRFEHLITHVARLRDDVASVIAVQSRRATVPATPQAQPLCLQNWARRHGRDLVRICLARWRNGL